MSDETNTIFTSEQISQRAQGNVNSLCLVMVAYLKEHDLSQDGFWSFVGRQFAPGWEQGASAKDVALEAALNMVSGGWELRSSSGDESQAQAVLGGWSSEESMARFGLTQEEADSVWGVFEPIAASLGYDYEWHRQGDEVKISISRQSRG